MGHSHVLPPAWRSPEKAHAVVVRMVHKAAARMRRLGYWAGCLSVSVQFTEGELWEERVALGLCRDTLTMLEAFERGWSALPAGQPFQVGAVLSRLVSDQCATQPLYGDQVRRNTLADVMDRINHAQGQHAIYFGGMFGAQSTAPTRISFTQIPTEEEFE